MATILTVGQKRYFPQGLLAVLKKYDDVLTSNFESGQKALEAFWKSLRKVFVKLFIQVEKRKMIISVASGKGGTGKTTIAVNLAWSLGGEAQILDCDVEEPNAHLFLKPELEERKTVFAEIPEIDEAKCDLCGKCVEICRFKAVAIVGGKVLTFPQMCHGCFGCLKVCPNEAISRSKKEIGTIDAGRAGDIEFCRGSLKIGEPMAPPLIKKVRSFAGADKITIIDAPPGTSCPVVAAMKGADFILMTAEPTPFGLHDLKLAVQTAKELGVPCGLAINRSDIGDDKVKKYAEKENIPVFMEIPFQRRIAEIYSRGGLIVEEMPEWKNKFIELFERMRSHVRSRAVREPDLASEQMSSGGNV